LYNDKWNNIPHYTQTEKYGRMKHQNIAITSIYAVFAASACKDLIHHMFNIIFFCKLFLKREGANLRVATNTGNMVLWFRFNSNQLS